ncbi:hypothetical protein ACQUWM_17200, partial [Marinobacter sp. DUT-3]|uniref:hypothetical protein n=1 Tax=Marinobacter sp. DUT-3 TaxID=3412036 RepID=UPI003D179A9A
SASAHTNYLVNFLKSVRGLPDQGGVFYIAPPPCQPFIFRCFRLRKPPKNEPAYCCIEARILH